LDGLEKYLNMAQLSKDYFGKQKTWKQFAGMLISLSENMKNVAFKLA
jgi:hypothetical protein